jgi:hypothetical protein
MNDIEEYINLVGVLENALKFYAEKENYLFYDKKDAPVALDEGSQARFALEKIKEMRESTEKMEDDYVKILSETIEKNNNDDGMLKLIEEIKKIKDGNI